MKTFDELAKLNDALIRARAARAANDCAATREVYAKAKQAYDRATATIGTELDLAQRTALQRYMASRAERCVQEG